MAMRFCERCGNSHECAVEDQANAEVEIERLRTRRDIEVARITASAAKDIAETDAETDLAHAEGEAEGMRDVLDAVTGGGDQVAEAEPVPVVLDAGDPADGAELEPEVEAPPESEPVTGAEPSRSGGWWGSYR